MYAINPLMKLPRSNKIEKKGMYSVCCSNEYVIRAAMRDATENGYVLVVESTANQVNQFGGYTGMTPNDYVTFVEHLAQEEGLERNHLILGGDHLGPLTWTNLNESDAMLKASDLIASYVKAGYSKIHIDTSMKLADDPDGPLSVDVSARRGAELASVVDDSFKEYQVNHPESPYPVLVVGSEVPVPGGSQEFEDKLHPTSPLDLKKQIGAFRMAFKEKNLDFSHVIGFVVQPGVEFGDSFVFQYNALVAKDLMASLSDESSLVFEGHSTDYQTLRSLSLMVRDGIGILKVGPELTFRLREALFNLCSIAKDLGMNDVEDFRETVLASMQENPEYWLKYYKGTDNEIQYKKIFSYSDRIRYYLPMKKVSDAIDRTINLVGIIPEGLLSQYFPIQYERYMEGRIKADAQSIIIDYIKHSCHKYAIACGTAKN